VGCGMLGSDVLTRHQNGTSRSARWVRGRPPLCAVGAVVLTVAARTISIMSSTSHGPGTPMPARPATAAEVNAAIRDLMRRAYGRPLYDDEAAEYETLLDDWWAASRTDMVRAA
jgi:hypothetical protein